MKKSRRHQWLLGGFTFLFFLCFPLFAFCEKASIQGVNLKATSEGGKVSFYVENCFTEKMEEAIQTGIQTVFTFYLNLYQKRSWWRDRKVASSEFHHTIRYDPIQGEYQVTLEEKGTSHVTRNFDEAKEIMSKVEEVAIQSSFKLKPEVPTYLRIKAELDPVRLPLHLEYLFFFVSLWNFETDWHHEPFSP